MKGGSPVVKEGDGTLKFISSLRRGVVWQREGEIFMRGQVKERKVVRLSTTGGKSEERNCYRDP